MHPALIFIVFVAGAVALLSNKDKTATSTDNPESPDTNAGDDISVDTAIDTAMNPTTSLVFHAERCPDNAPLQAFIEWWKSHGPFPIVITSGLRTEEQQAALYAQGRTTPGKIVTNANSASNSPHGRGAAIDCAPVRASVGPLVRTIYTGNETQDDMEDDRQAVDIAQERIAQYVALVKEHGLTSGADFPGLKDTPHAEDPNWQSLPFPVES